MFIHKLLNNSMGWGLPPPQERRERENLGPDAANQDHHYNSHSHQGPSWGIYFTKKENV